MPFKDHHLSLPSGKHVGEILLIRASRPSCLSAYPLCSFSFWRFLMETLYSRCAGLDIHKKSVVACLILTDEHGHRHKHRFTFSTMLADLCRLRDLLVSQQITHVAIESTGVFWKPIYNRESRYFAMLLRGKTATRSTECMTFLHRHLSVHGACAHQASEKKPHGDLRPRACLIVTEHAIMIAFQMRRCSFITARP